MQRIRFVIVPGLVAILIFFSIDLFDRITDEPDPAEVTTTVVYDGYSEGINTILFNALGEVDYTLQARRQVSYQNAISEFEEPLIQLYRAGNTHWKITAESGKVSTTGDESVGFNQIDLAGSVEVRQMDEFGNQTLFSTEFLSVDPTRETMNTDLPVTMTSDNITQSAIGMSINLSNDEAVFQREVRGRYATQSN
ncbi:MAG: LPS export ABC transporter periplasmic protein LptC [Gammaproteobacteria bacterium]|nr:LPS export ABC transporter periplasmic protein LptC [Gammaproteobacteria bacterium]